MPKKEVFRGNKNHYLIFEMLSLGKISKKEDTSFKRGTLKGFGSLSQNRSLELFKLPPTMLQWKSHRFTKRK